MRGGQRSHLKPTTPMHGGQRSHLKPVTPMRGGQRSHLKPTTPLRSSNRQKQAHSRPQRRHRFHEPHQPHPQRQHRFHQRPTNTTGDTAPQPPDSHQRDLSTGEMLNASYPQGHNSSFSSHSRREIIHQSGPYPQLHMVVSNCYLNSSHPSDRRFALLAFMERKCSCIASERTATF